MSFLVVLGQTPIPAAPRAVSVVTVSERHLAGSLVGISEAGIVTVKRPSGKVVRVPLEDVIRVDLRPADKAPSPETAGTLYLATGGQLRGRVLTSDKTAVAFESPLLGRASIGFDGLLAYVPPRPQGAPDKHRVFVRELTAGTAREDVVYLANGDRIPGVIEMLTPGKVVVSGPLGRREYAGTDVTAVAFSRERRQPRLPDSLYVVLAFVDGSVLSARITSMSNQVFMLEAVVGCHLNAKAETISRLEVRNGRVVRLSDVKPARVTYVPYYNRVWPMRRDLSVWGGPLTVKGRTFTSGLGLASRTTLVYALDGTFDRLEAHVGIDDETRGTGEALLTITTDGRRAFNRTLTGGKPAVAVNVPLAGIKELVILVDFAGGTDIGDHVDLGNARLIRAKRE